MNARGRWIPWVFVAGMGVVVVVNGLMAWFAFSTFSGVVTRSAFDASQSYNAVIAAHEAQAARGWRITARIERDRLVVVAEDREGRPLEDLSVDARLTRPVERTREIVVAPVAEAGGRYAAPLDRPGAGQWELRLVARRGDETHGLSQRLIMP
jgi:nitrogen fixation protein FixH